ncbi:MAG: LD-carboxypeptidase [Cyanobacteria bacterium P01_E01_bin.42]
MKKRTLLAALSGSAAFLGMRSLSVLGTTALKQSNLIKPRALKAGDTVGIITPSSPILDPDDRAKIPVLLDSWGLRVKFAPHVGSRGTFSESIGDRADDLHAMFADPEVQAIMMQGGYGAMQILDRLDWNLIANNPKIFVGFSDITALHLAIHQKTRLVTFHGPNPFSIFNEYTSNTFQQALFQTQPLGILTNPPEDNPRRPTHRLRTVRSGQGTGALIGGNLSLIAALMGTPFEIETAGKILFLEDIGEGTYQIDRMLTQLRLAGKFAGVRGIIWAECNRCGTNSPNSTSIYTLGEVIDGILGSVGVPVLSGMTLGHTANKLTLPLGIEATLDAEAGTLEILDSGVV